MVEVPRHRLRRGTYPRYRMCELCGTEEGSNVWLTRHIPSWKFWEKEWPFLIAAYLKLMEERRAVFRADEERRIKENAAVWGTLTASEKTPETSVDPVTPDFSDVPPGKTVLKYRVTMSDPWKSKENE